MKLRFPLLFLTIFTLPVFSESLEKNVSYEENLKMKIEKIERINNGAKLSPNGLATKLVVHHKGAYLAFIKMSYLTPNKDGQFDLVSISSNGLYAESLHEWRIPVDAIDLQLTITAATGLIWEPVKVVYSGVLCQYNNIWTDGVYNRMQLDLWASTFNPQGALVQPYNTSYNGADTALTCGEY